MKKLLIVNNNLKVGGVQKSLYNLLWSLEGDYDITLCLFKNIGDYSEKLPKSVKVTEAKGLFRYLGVSQSEVKGLDGIKRAILAAVSRMLGRKFTLKLLISVKKHARTITIARYLSFITVKINLSTDSFRITLSTA